MKRISFILIFFIFPLNIYTQFEYWYDLSPGVCNGYIIFGDIDSDGDLDLAMSGSSNLNYLKIYENNGTGNLNEWQNLSPAVYCSSIALGDIDSDGDLDLIMTGYTGTEGVFKVYQNNGIGNFSWWYDLSPGVLHGSLALGDVDLDGDLDLIMTGYTGTEGVFKVYQNNGIGNFSWWYDLSPGVSHGSLALGDIDNDCNLDLIMTGSLGVSSVSKVYKNNGTGNFNFWYNLDTGVEDGSIALGDINADSDLDLIITGNNRNVFPYNSKVYTNNGAGNLSFSYDLSIGVDWGSSIALGDIDLDGYLDLVMAGFNTSWGYFKVYTNNKSGNLSEIQNLIPGVFMSSIALGDLNSGGDLDLIMTGYYDNTKNYFRVYQNTNLLINNSPIIPIGMNVTNIEGYWRFRWNAPLDDFTPQNMLQYKIAIGINKSGSYDYTSTAIDYPRGQANIGNVPQGGIGATNCYYQSKIPVTTRVYWKVCALDTSFKSSGYCEEQVADNLFSKITTLEPSEGKFFRRNGKIKGIANSSGKGLNALAYVKIRIKNINANTYWDGRKWTNFTNIWIQVSGKENWEYVCNGISWEFGQIHYVESIAVANNGVITGISEKVEFIPVYQLTKWSFCNYPNPFDPNKEKTCIEYLLLKNEEVRLLIYEISGRIVKEWKFKAGSDGAREGINKIYWDGKNDDGYIVANGVYFCYLKKKGSEKMTKIMVVK